MIKIPLGTGQTLVNVQAKLSGNNNLQLRDHQEADHGLLYQNIPNPFKANTVIGFNLPSAGPATIKITDLSGKTVREIFGQYLRGYNEVSIEKLDVKGVLYYQLINGEQILTKKMINLD